MITSNALASDVSLPSMEAVNSDASPAPVSGDARPGESFAKLMNDSMSDQQQSPSASATSPTKPTKDDKKDKDKGSENAAAASVLTTIVMAPVPPATTPTVAKTSTPAGNESVVDVAALVASAATVSSNPKAVSVPAYKPLNKEGVENKSSSPLENKLAGNTASKSATVDMSNDDSASPREDHPPSQPSNLPTAAPSTTVPTPGGTATAKQVVTVKMQEKMEGNTRTAEKNLPHGNFLPDSSQSNATEVSPRTAIIPEAHVAQGNATSSMAVPALAGVSHDRTGATESSTRLETVRSPQVDRVLTEVSESAVSFKRIGAESVDVNLQPDRGTEISLHLTLNNGQVEMAARLERGNFDSLNTHWSDLQESLGQQGIRVGQLESASLNQNPEGNQNRNQTAFAQTMQQESGGQRQHPSGRTTEAADVPVLTRASATPRRASSSPGTGPARRGWEMWA